MRHRSGRKSRRVSALSTHRASAPLLNRTKGEGDSQPPECIAEVEK